MAITDSDPSQAPPSLKEMAEAVADKIVSVQNIERLSKGGENAITSGLKIAVGAVIGSLGALGALLAEILVDAETVADPAFQRLLSVAFKDITGIDMSASSTTMGGRDGRAAAAQSLGAAVMKAIAGTGGASGAGGTLEPSQKPAEEYVTWVTQLSLEGWLTGTLGELVSLGFIKNLGDLDDTLANSLGLGRMTRRVMGPLLDAKVVTPFQWHVNKTYRPSLLSTSLAVRQFSRGKWTREQLDEELARQGWSPERIEALVHDGTQRMGDGTIKALRAQNILDDSQAVARLRENGWTAEEADKLTIAWNLERVYAYGDRELSAIASARIAGELDDTQARAAAGYLLPNDELKASFLSYVNHAREYRVQHMSHSEMIDCVERGIASRHDYRNWLTRENYAPNEALMLELRLEAMLRGQQEAEKKRKELELERAADKQRAADERAARAAEIALKKARTPAALSDLERAVVRGILPIAVYDARLDELKYSADDRAFMVELLQQQREDYLVAQEKKANQDGELARKSISLASIERAVLRGIVTLDDYRRRLVSEGLDAADVDVMVALLAGELADRARAEAKRAEVAAAAAVRGLSLGQVEKAVRQGLASAGDYRAWLLAEGFPAEDAALLVTSLTQDIAEANAAAERRAVVNTTAAARGVSLAQLERAVKLGVLELSDYQAKLIALEVSTDDQVTLMGILRAELALLDQARAKRNEPAPATEPPGLSRADIERAARAGVVSVQQYRDYLGARGYSADDVDLLSTLMLLELQNTQQARQTRTQVDAGNPERALARADMERAVKKGLRDLNDYAAFVAGANYSAADQELLVSLLTIELDANQAAQVRRDKLAGELAGRGLDLDALDAAAVAGELTIDGYVQALAAAGVTPADLGLLVQLILEQQPIG